MRPADSRADYWISGSDDVPLEGIMRERHVCVPKTCGGVRAAGRNRSASRRRPHRRAARSPSSHSRTTARMADDKKLTTRAADFSAWYNEVVLAVASSPTTRPSAAAWSSAPMATASGKRMQRQLEQHVQGDRPPERVLSRCSSRSRSCTRRRSTSRGSLPKRPSSRTGAGRSSRNRSSYGPRRRRSYTTCRQVGAELSRPAHPDEPVANVVRWEMRTRLFLRRPSSSGRKDIPLTSPTTRRRRKRARCLGVYRDFMEGYIAMPVVTGTEDRR